MNTLPPDFRAATPDDAPAMAELVNIAGEGLPFYLWSQIAGPDGDPWAVGRERARRDQGGFSWRNTVLREDDGRIAACMIGYPLPDEAAPIDYAELPPMFVPLQQLEDLAPGTWYVNVLATFPEFRRRGYASAMIGIAEQRAADTGRHGLSIIVADTNTEARRLYENAGFRERARRPMVKETWESRGENWVLLIRDAA